MVSTNHFDSEQSNKFATEAIIGIEYKNTLILVLSVVVFYIFFNLLNAVSIW
jgi:hypothetical protein